MNNSMSNLPLLYYRLSLHRPAPTKKRKDKEEKLVAEAGAERGNYKVQQEKIPAKWQDPITSAQNKISTYFNRNAFRVDDNYAIPVSHYESFEAGYKSLIDEHDVYVNALCQAIESGELMEEAKRRAGNDFDPNMIPASCEQVKGAIWVEVSTKADLSNPVIAKALSELAGETKVEVENRIRADMEKAEANGQASIVGFVLDEVVEFLKDMQERCDKDSKNARYKSLLDKFIRVTEKLPSYNITGSPVISNAIAKVYEAFKTLDTDHLRENEDYRKKQVETAKGILEQIQSENLF